MTRRQTAVSVLVLIPDRGWTWRALAALALPAGVQTAAAQGNSAAPTFGGATVRNQSYVVGKSIARLTLPAATGGNGALEYGLSPAPPKGFPARRGVLCANEAVPRIGVRRVREQRRRTLDREPDGQTPAQGAHAFMSS